MIGFMTLSERSVEYQVSVFMTLSERSVEYQVSVFITRPLIHSN